MTGAPGALADAPTRDLNEPPLAELLRRMQDAFAGRGRSKNVMMARPRADVFEDLRVPQFTGGPPAGDR
jgi:hypothetical protein